jgi:hypothetical protein
MVAAAWGDASHVLAFVALLLLAALVARYIHGGD